MQPIRMVNSILVVDDNSIFTEMLVPMLTDLGYSAVPYNNPGRALDMFSANPYRFDMAIVDEKMPGMTGSELTAQLRQVKEDFPVILLTGYGNTLTMRQLRSTGFRAVLMKPLLKDDLRIALEKALRRGPY
jgi:two-component system, cell cycle sensor histidine kinase and response regulator CckA